MTHPASTEPLPAPGPDVVVVGNVGVDTNVYLYGADIDWSREANFTENIDYVGQAGGYAARGYAQLGKRTAFIGHVGEDANGQFVRQELARDGIDLRDLFVDPAGTSRSVNIMYQDGRRKNFYDGKGHMTLRPDVEACRAILSGAQLAHFNLPNWGRLLLPVAKACGLTIACDLQDLVTLHDPYRQEFLRWADILFFSAANQGDPLPLMEALLSADPRRVVVAGMGAQGCACGSKAGIRKYPPVHLDLPVIDTNGAGDGLAVGFLTSYVLDGYSLEDSIRRGQIVARYTCSIRASTSTLIRPEQLENYFHSI